LVTIARYEATVRLTEESEKRILSTRKLIEHWVQEEKIILYTHLRKIVTVHEEP
jgi:histidine ammonia-lyase